MKKKKFQISKNYLALAVILILVVGAIYFLEMRDADVTGNVINQGLSTDMKDGKYPKAPELRGISDFLNTNEEQITLEELEGKVVLIDFWTYTCVNCIRTFPYLTEWDERYKDKGLVIIGVHTPEFEFEKNKENVLASMKKHGIKYPVVQDNNYVTWRSYNNRFWPAKYLIDSEGYVRYVHFGEGAYQETEMEIQKLLAEIGNEVDLIPADFNEPEKVSVTRELYGGYNFALPREQNLGNPSGFVPDKVVNYIISESTLDPEIIYLQGSWKNNPDDLQLVSSEGTIILGYSAREVNIVASPALNNKQVEVTIDGKYVPRNMAGKDLRYSGQRSYLVVDKPRMYNVINGDLGIHVLGLGAREGFSFNAFTFG